MCAVTFETCLFVRWELWKPPYNDHNRHGSKKENCANVYITPYIEKTTFF